MTEYHSTKTRHRQILEAIVFEGLTNNEACKRFGISPSRLSVLRNSTLWKMQEQELRERYVSEYRDKLRSLIPKAIGALEQTVEPFSVIAEGTPNQKTIYNDPRIRISSAREILSRTGITETVEVKQSVEYDKATLLDTLDKIREEKQNLLKELELQEQEGDNNAD